MPDNFIIDDSTNNDLLYPKGFGTGFDPAQVTQGEFPQLFGDAPNQLKVIPRSEWSARIKEQEETRSSLSHLRQICGPNGGQMPTLDQNGQGYCWAYSTTRAVMYLRAMQNQPYVRLSAHAIGCMVKGFRDEGGWCGLSAKFHREKGCPSVEFWKEKSMNRSNDNPATWDNAAGHIVTEEWVDLGQAVYDQNLTEEQIATCLLLNIPVAADFSWWGHSVLLRRLTEPERGDFGYDGDNSWTDGWGEQGSFVLRGSKKNTMGAIALRVVTASLN